jgi:hypothetical protein
MPHQIDSHIADRLISAAISRLNSSHGKAVLCTRSALEAVLLAAVHEAHEIGFLAGQQDRYAELTRPGSPTRPVWMDIRFDSQKELLRHGIRLKPVVLQSLAAAGYRCLGDVRWIPERQLTGLHYVGVKTARALRAVVQSFEASESSFDSIGPAPQAADGVSPPRPPTTFFPA